jgi:hypothetical protein
VSDDADIPATQRRLPIKRSGNVEKRQAIFDQMNARLTKRRESNGRVGGKRCRVARRGALGGGMEDSLEHHHGLLH